MPFVIKTETRAVVRSDDDWEVIALFTVKDSEAEESLAFAASDVVVIDDDRTGGEGDLYEFRITATYEKEN